MRVAERVADRVSDVTDRVQTRRLESKRESLDRDNERLRTELRTIRDELERERGARDELLHALKKQGNGTTMKADKVKVKTKRRGGFLRMLVVGGGAYILGTRAGRERYEQIKGWASDMRERVRGGGEDEWGPASAGPTTGMTASSGISGATGAPTTGTGSVSTTGVTPPSGSSPTTGTSTTGGTTGTGTSKSTKRTGSSGTTSG
jgi:hypothetical protein